MNDIPKISVIVITYNQEEVIRRTIDSLIDQKDYIYEICISDDCSKDKTWKILQDYSSQYPGLFKLNRNDSNLGIFENIEKTWTIPSGDLVYYLAGDDVAGDNWFKTVINYIEFHQIDFKNEKICICCNSISIYPNGDKLTIKKNRNVELKIPPIRLYERGLVGPRGNVYSINVLYQFEKVSQGRSFVAENAQDCQQYIFSEKFYYINKVGNIYYSGIGVSSNMTAERKSQHEQTMVYAFEFLRKHNAPLSRRDHYLPQLNIAQKHMRWNPSIENYYKLLYYRFKTFDFYLWIHSFDIMTKLFPFVRRIPHKTPINW